MPDDLPPQSSGERDSHWRHQEGDEQPTTPQTERGAHLALLALAIAALLGVAFGLFTWFGSGKRSPTFVLSLVVFEHEDPLYPPHKVALADSEAILKHFANLQGAQRGHGLQSQARDNLESEFRKLAKQTEGPVVVHVSCQARTLGGSVYLLPSDAHPEQQDTWLKLDTVLGHLAACPAKDKLLLLDIAHPLADGRLGIVYDDVAAGVKTLLEQQPESTLQVLNSCAAAQTALTSDKLGCSVFAHFVDQGLRGAADDWGPAGFADKRIMVKELAAYVRYHTEGWAKANRELKQTPWLWGQGEDFPLADLNVGAAPEEKKAEDKKKEEKEAKKEEAKPPEKKDGEKKDGEKKEAEKKEPPPKFPYPAKLKKAWELRDKLASHDKARVAPAVLWHIDLRLLQAELGWKGRGETEVDNLLAELKGHEGRFDAGPAKQPWEQPPPSLAIAMTRLDPPAQPLVKGVRDGLQRLVVSAEKAATPKEKQEQAALEKKDKAALEAEALKLMKEVKAAPELQKVAALLEALRVLDNPNRLQTAFIRETVEALLLGQVPAEYVETAWLKRAGAFDLFRQEREWDWPAAALGQSLRTLYVAEGLVALLGQEPQFLPWLSPESFGSAEEARRQGEKLLYWGKWGAKPAQRTEMVLSKLSQAADEYDDLRRALQQLRAAHIAHERAFVELPAHFLWLSARAEVDAERENAWREAVEMTNRLSLQLTGGPAPANIKQIKDRPVLIPLDALQARRSESVAEIIKLGTDQPPGALAPMRALRAAPGLSPAERERLWQLEQELADELFKKFELQAEPVRQVSLTAPAPDEEWRKKTSAARLRAELAIDFLSLAQLPKAAEAREALTQLADDPAPQAWEKLGWALRSAWFELRGPGAPGKITAAAGFKHLLPIVAGDPPPGALDIEPAAGAATAFSAWLSARYRSEAKFVEAADKAPDSSGFISPDSGFFTKSADRLKR
jgi:hypothetical protein